MEITSSSGMYKIVLKNRDSLHARLKSFYKAWSYKRKKKKKIKSKQGKLFRKNLKTKGVY